VKSGEIAWCTRWDKILDEAKTMASWQWGLQFQQGTVAYHGAPLRRHRATEPWLLERLLNAILGLCGLQAAVDDDTMGTRKDAIHDTGGGRLAHGRQENMRRSSTMGGCTETHVDKGCPSVGCLDEGHRSIPGEIEENPLRGDQITDEEAF